MKEHKSILIFKLIQTVDPVILSTFTEYNGETDKGILFMIGVKEDTEEILVVRPHASVDLLNLQNGTAKVLAIPFDLYRTHCRVLLTFEFNNN